jgi:hypothetical protein
MLCQIPGGSGRSRWARALRGSRRSAFSVRQNDDLILRDLPVLNSHDSMTAVAQGGVVGDDHECLATFTVEPDEQIHHLSGRFGLPPGMVNTVSPACVYLLFGYTQGTRNEGDAR